MDKQKITSFLYEQRRMQLQRPFSTMIKVAGALCNLDCDYCYYLEKGELYPEKRFNLSEFRMKEQVLEQFIRDFLYSQPQEQVEFVWHGGEPTLLGLDYFRRILALQQKYADGKKVLNVLQTNGTLIDDDWAAFLADHYFLCGLSIDGPKRVHDKHRKTVDKQGSWEKVVACTRLFQKHGVEFNTMSVVNSSNCKEPVAVYEFLKELGSRYMQFTPIVERIALDEQETLSMVHPQYNKEAVLMEESITAKEWGNFLCRIFDRWVKTDVGSYYVNWFDNTLAAYVGEQPSLCSMAPYCGCSLAVEHDGDVFCCDHFVYPEYRLGNLLKQNISELAKSDKQLYFEEAKKETLSAVCQRCVYLPMCGGDCPKNRISRTSQGEAISCLCEGFMQYFKHTQPYFEFMANELKNGRPPANVMGWGFRR